DLVDAARGGLAVEPGEEVRHRRAVAPVGGAGALDLGGVLAGLGQVAGIWHPYDAGLAALQPAMEPDRRRRAETHGLAGLLQRREPGGQGRRLAEPSERRQVCLGLAADLGGVDEQL